MRSRPNPWLVIPSLIGGILAAVIGWMVTDVSCRVETQPGVIESCSGWAATVAIVSFVGVTLAMLVVMVLVARSIAEARAAHAVGQEPPGPGCEVPDDVARGPDQD